MLFLCQMKERQPDLCWVVGLRCSRVGFVSWPLFFSASLFCSEDGDGFLFFLYERNTEIQRCTFYAAFRLSSRSCLHPVIFPAAVSRFYISGWTTAVVTRSYPVLLPPAHQLLQRLASNHNLLSSAATITQLIHICAPAEMDPASESKKVDSKLKFFSRGISIFK